MKSRSSVATQPPLPWFSPWRVSAFSLSLDITVTCVSHAVRNLALKYCCIFFFCVSSCGKVLHYLSGFKVIKQLGSQWEALGCFSFPRFLKSLLYVTALYLSSRKCLAEAVCCLSTTLLKSRLVIHHKNKTKKTGELQLPVSLYSKYELLFAWFCLSQAVSLNIRVKHVHAQQKLCLLSISNSNLYEVEYTVRHSVNPSVCVFF